MAKQLWNLGRVVGYSAYEIYVKHAFLADPNTTPASEQEWLASTLGMGASMLVKIEADDIEQPHYRDIQFPDSCRLCAANTIIASLFHGSGDTSENPPWVNRVTSYGTLLGNNQLVSPNGTIGEDDEIFPEDDLISPTMASQINAFMSIADGIIIQPGTWLPSPLGYAQKDFRPNLTKHPRLRLLFTSSVKEPFYLLLTGFTSRGIIVGTTITDTATGTPNPEDGDFLGPVVFPWSAKVVFSVPPAYMHFATSSNGAYARAFESDDSYITVSDLPLVDLASSGTDTFYTDDLAVSGINIDVQSKLPEDTPVAVLSAYRTSDKLPPALYGGVIDSTGEKTLYPIDTASPWNVKMFTDADVNTSVELAKELESTDLYNIGLVRNQSSMVVYELNSDVNYELLPISDDRTENINVLQMYNTPYIWPYKHGSGTSMPTIDDLKSVDTLFVTRGLVGYVSHNFIAEFCFSNEEIQNMINDGSFIKLESVFNSLRNQLANPDDYVYAIFGGYATQPAVSQQYYVVPIDMSTHALYTALPSTFKIEGLKKGIDLSNKLDFVGSFWNAVQNVPPDNPSRADYGVDNFIADHPIQSVAVPDFRTYYQPKAITPNPPFGTFGYNFVSWFKSMPMSVLFDDSSDITADYGIHPSYLRMSLHEFLMACVTHRVDMDYNSPDSIKTSMGSLKETRFIYTKMAVVDTIQGATFEGVNKDGKAETYFNVPLISKLRLEAAFNPVGFYTPVVVKLLDLDIVPNGMTGADFEYTATIGDDMASKYSSSEDSIWVAIGQSGQHQTRAISLQDNNGTPLSLQGTMGSVSVDTIRWSDLLASLCHNTSLDVLGDLVKIKAALELASDGVSYCITKQSDGTITLTPATGGSGDLPSEILAVE